MPPKQPSRRRPPRHRAPTVPPDPPSRFPFPSADSKTLLVLFDRSFAAAVAAYLLYSVNNGVAELQRALTHQSDMLAQVLMRGPCPYP